MLLESGTDHDRKMAVAVDARNNYRLNNTQTGTLAEFGASPSIVQSVIVSDCTQYTLKNFFSRVGLEMKPSPSAS